MSERMDARLRFHEAELIGRLLARREDLFPRTFDELIDELIDELKDELKDAKRETGRPSTNPRNRLDSGIPETEDLPQ